MRLSQKYADHEAELDAMMAYIANEDGTPNDNATRLGITAADINGLTQARTFWTTAYAEYRAPATHNAITVAAMKQADNEMYALVLPLRQRLKHGGALTVEDYAQLTIHRDKETRTPAEVPHEEPVPVFVHSEPLNLTFEATEQTTEGIHHLALPKGYRLARMLAVVPQGTVPTDADYHSLDTIGRSRFTLTFTTAEIGSHAYIRLAYENTAGRGPWSHSVKAPII